MIGFAEFVQATAGRAPYPWQVRLAEALANDVPIEFVTAPTGSGKTTALDAAVWALAKQADRPAPARTLGVRLIWAIDRRLLVDDVFQQAEILAERLDRAVAESTDAVHEVACRLLALARDGRWSPEFDPRQAQAAGTRPLEVGRWRGGIPTTLEASSPFQPQIITSTVPQIGSRLLFRGYGVSSRSRALEAGLVGRDTLVFLDEAHLAVPFRETVDAIRRMQHDQPREQLTLPPALRLVTLTATPPAHDANRAIGLSDADRSHPGLRPRLEARKQLSLREAPEKPVDELASLAIEAALAPPTDGRSPVVGVVVNRVRTALEVDKAIEKAFKGIDEAPHRVVLIGPQRPADRRTQLTSQARAWIYGEAPAERPVIVIATQTIEVGVDANLSHLVTQSASVAATVQRLGRLNRQGNWGDAQAIVVRDPGFPLYKDDEPAAWEWLQTVVESGGDVSVAALAQATFPAQSPPATAPLLHEGILQQLAQTTDPLGPLQEPDVDGLLRGATEAPALDVTVCWRAGLDPDDGSVTAMVRRASLGRLAPPHPDEVLTLPIGTARRLITGDRGGVKAVLDGPDAATTVPDDLVPAKRDLRFTVLRGRDVREGSSAAVRGDDPDGEPILGPRDLRPGDLVVLPLEAGGISERGLDGSVQRATDCLLEVNAVAPVRAVRLSREIWELLSQGDRDDGTALPAWQEIASRCRERIRAAADAGLARGHWSSVEIAPGDVASLVGDHLAALHTTDADSGWLLRELVTPDAVDPLPGSITGRDENERGEVADENADRLSRGEWVLIRRTQRGTEGGAAHGAPPTLDDHCRDVAERAASWAAAAGLPNGAVAAMRLAGLAHDAGKADPRLQAWFSGGQRTAGSPLLAKSVFGTDDPARSRAAKRAAGMPNRLRHELASVAFLANALQRGTSEALTAEADTELALYLVGTHHGYGRPGFPLPTGGAPAARWRATVSGLEGSAHGDGLDGWQDGAWFARFAEVFDRFGPWTAAYLEALLMLADRTISKEGR